ncbi:MAG: HDIG domain-containing protein [Bacteroidales bacterium]
MKAGNQGKFSSLSRVFLYLCTILVLFWMFPREAKFRYEFQKGRPWMHETLIAPFDFPIYKSDAILKAEKDSLLKTLLLYFRIDTLVSSTESQRLDSLFQQRWESSLAVTGKEKSFLALGSNDNESVSEIKKLLVANLRNLYQKGVIDLNDNPANKLNNYTSIEVLKNNIATETPLTDIYTVRTAYESLITNTAAAYRFHGQNARSLETLLRTLNLNDFIRPNLHFDSDKTKLEERARIDEISLTEGMVLEGERIISKGVRVDDYHYQVLVSLKREFEESRLAGGRPILLPLGHLILVTIMVLMIYLFLQSFRKEVYQNQIKTFFILLLVVGMAATTRIVTSFPNLSVYLIPFAILAILVKTFYDSRLALFIHMITILLAGFWVPNSFEFVFSNFIAGIVAIFSLSNLYRRVKFFLSAVLVTVSFSVVFIAFSFIQESQISAIEPDNFIWFVINGMLVLSSFPLIYIFERIFGFLSDATLMELTDTNQPLLRKLAEVAPGTFQHSLQVANLAEDVLVHVGGNPLLVRAGALYHDIGKMENPLAYIENQSADVNFHDQLEFQDSARIVIGHVQAGILLAHKHKLPQQIIDFIPTHHGTTLTKYFYKSFLKSNPGIEPEIEQFRYPGPRPFTREMAIVMMADAVEAASRSLKKTDEASISRLVDDIINQQLEDKQFNEANITFRDIEVAREVFKRRLRNIFHVRIAYPK